MKKLKFLKAIFILFKANWKQQTKSKKTAILILFTPMIYGIVYFINVLILYEINPNAFSGLSKNEYIFGFLILQCIIHSDFNIYTSIREIGKKVQNSELDLVLLKPVKFSVFKYFMKVNYEAIFMTLFYHLWLIFMFVFLEKNIFDISKIYFFIFIVIFIRMNFISFLTGSVFFIRDFKQVLRLRSIVHETLAIKPPEVFASSIMFNIVFLYFTPFILIHSKVFDLIRGKDDFFFWSITLFWTGFSMFLNWIIWKKGLEKYESMG